MKVRDLTGARFGELIALNREPSVSKRTMWRCACDCGKVIVAQFGNLISGKTRTCGCGVARSAKQRFTTHGMTRSPEYEIWSAAKKRCYNPAIRQFHNYGGRGIQMCQEWRDSFESFLRDMGPRPSSRHSIDRIDNDGDYEPSNCRWATYEEQARNRTDTIKVILNGEELPLLDAANRVGIKPTTLRARLRRGWTMHQVLTGEGKRKGVIKSSP